MYQLFLSFRMRAAGLYMALPLRSISHVAHLYNAMQVTSALETPWPKMEQFVSTCTPEKLFVGGLPTSLEDCYQKYSLIAEISLKIFAPNQRSRHEGSRFVRSKKGLRDWSPSSPIIEIMKQRFFFLQSDEYWIYSIESLIQDKQGARARGGKQPDIGACQLLDFLRDALPAEQSRLNYDFLGMHFQCMEILREIKTKMDDKFKNAFGSEYIQYDSLLFQIVFCVLIRASSAEKIAKSLGLVRPCDIQPIAAAALQRAIDAEDL